MAKDFEENTDVLLSQINWGPAGAGAEKLSEGLDLPIRFGKIPKILV